MSYRSRSAPVPSLQPCGEVKQGYMCEYGMYISICLYIVFKKNFIKWLLLLNILLTHECTCKCDQSKKVELGLTKDVTEDSTFAKLILFIRLTFYVGGKYSRKKQITKFFSATATKVTVSVHILWCRIPETLKE